MKRKITILASLLGLLAACSQSAGSAPTPFPPDYLPTVVALTGQAAISASNTLTAAVPLETIPPTETLMPPVDNLTEYPTVTPTIAPGFNDFAKIRFLSPGPMSSLVSPFNLQLLIVSGESDIIQVDLLGEDGRILQRVLERVEHNPSGRYRNFDLSFEIRAVSEAGYIRVSTKDEYGRIQALSTMPVLLYSVGTSQINPPGNTIYERTMLEGLQDEDEVSGGVVNLKGLFWPFNDQLVFVELLLSNGKPLSSRQLDFNGTEPEAFETTLPYNVTEPTWARLTFRQENPLLAVIDPDLLRYIYIYTINILLKP